MAVRVTASEVKAIMDIELTDAAVDIFIGIANPIVTDNLDTATTLTDAQLKEIERWLTAHLISVTKERRGKAEKLGEASITYQGIFGVGLKATEYGQMLEVLDTSGTLAGLGKKKISIKAITSFE